MATTVDLSEFTTRPIQKTLIKAWWKKVILNNPNALDIPELRRRKVTTLERGRVFGIPLIESIRYAHSRISYMDDRTGKICNGYIPTIIAKCGAFLKDQATSTEGIFRISGNAKRIAMLQNIFDASFDEFGLHLNWYSYTVHDASNIMRRFLNHLPEPVITTKYQPLFKNTLDVEFSSIEEKVNAFQALIDQLPIVHQYVLLYLLDLLYLFSLCSNSTKMDISSLATAFAPCILSNNPQDAMDLTKYKESQRIVLFLIEHQDKFSLPITQSIPPFDYIDTSCKSTTQLKKQQQTTKKTTSSSMIDLREQRPYSTPPPLKDSPHQSITDLSVATVTTNISRSLTLDPKSTTLKRSRTAPSRQRHIDNSIQEITSLPPLSSKSGDSGFFSKSAISLSSTTISNNNTRNVATSNKWKSIKRVVKEEEEE